jgi:predicted RNase H-like nuclease (RuvC/YqgF family)
MKVTISILALATLMAGAMLTSCQSSAKKAENARDNLQEAKDNVIEAKQELNQALNDSIQQFKKDSKEKISNNEKIIAEFKARIAKSEKATKVKYEKTVAELEQKNNDLKKKLENYMDEGQDKWTSFKSEFNHDIDELGLALKDLTVKNLK